LCNLPKIEDKNLIIGLDTADDAAVYKLSEDTAIIQTLDFFTPVVDDPYEFGQIAAANSLSDVYAMGGKPLLAMNIVCFPTCISLDILGDILRGGADKVKEAGATLVGGHSVDDNEPKYGLSVTGLVHPDKVMGNNMAKEGDVLVLTKPVGSGILNTAIKADLLSHEEKREVIKIMANLNKVAAEGMNMCEANACTDITGFGLLGHCLEMAKASGVTIIINSDNMPIMGKALEYAQMGLIPAGAYKNENYIKSHLEISDEVNRELIDIMNDPQTSGGLLVSIPKERVSNLMEFYENNLDTEFRIVGEVIKKKDKYIYVK
jgi:selenide,water dikinase